MIQYFIDGNMLFSQTYLLGRFVRKCYRRNVGKKLVDLQICASLNNIYSDEMSWNHRVNFSHICNDFSNRSIDVFRETSVDARHVARESGGLFYVGEFEHAGSKALQSGRRAAVGR